MYDHYEALGVARDADRATIRAAWHRIARVTHPDLSDEPDALDDFKRASAAWRVLRDPEARQAYDLSQRVLATMQCQCGRQKLPTHARCVWCSLRDYQIAQEKERAQRREEKKRRERARARFVSPPHQGEYTRARPRPDEMHAEYADPWDYSDEFRVPSSDALLEAMLSDAAMRALRGRARPQDIQIHFEVTPDGRLNVGGATVETLRDLQQNLQRGQTILGHLRRFLGLTGRSGGG
jgi:curved DNA-binding protein CbpA